MLILVALVLLALAGLGVCARILVLERRRAAQTSARTARLEALLRDYFPEDLPEADDDPILRVEIGQTGPASKKPQGLRSYSVELDGTVVYSDGERVVPGPHPPPEPQMRVE